MPLRVSAPLKAGGTAVESAVKSLVDESHSHTPSVTTGRMWSTGLLATQCATSLFTHSDAADSGEANNTNQSLSASAVSIADHKCGFVDNPVSSRNTCNARRLFHRFANRCNPRCNAGANRPSAAWLYEMNPSYMLRVSRFGRLALSVPAGVGEQGCAGVLVRRGRADE